MRAFKDTGGRTWEIKVTLATISRVFAECQVDLTQIFDRDSAAAKAMSSVPVFSGVLCAVLRPQLDAKNVREVDLLESLDEEATEAAVIALHESVCDFFPKPKREVIGPAFRKMVTIVEKLQEKNRKEAMERLESLDFEKVVSMAAGSNGSAGGLRESSESTPSHAPSPNSM